MDGLKPTDKTEEELRKRVKSVQIFGDNMQHKYEFHFVPTFYSRKVK
jgi:hypothetical protein